LSIEVWIFRNGQLDRNDDRRHFVAMTLTLKQQLSMKNIIGYAPFVVSTIRLFCHSWLITGL